MRHVCPKHGNLTTKFFLGSQSIAVDGKPLAPPHCPRCLAEWLAEKFPVIEVKDAPLTNIRTDADDRPDFGFGPGMPPILDG